MSFSQMDHLSNLPDELLVTILSLLPTHIAARTSILSRIFRHLWKASPSLLFITQDFPPPHDKNFIAMADHALLHRHPSLPLLSLSLKSPSSSSSFLLDSYMPSLLAKALSLGLRHLTIEGYLNLLPFLPTIFSIQSLESLSLTSNFHFWSGQYYIFPSGFKMTFLRSLSLQLYTVDPASLSRLVSELCSLEDLYLHIYNMDKIRLSSQTIRKLELISSYQKLDTVELFLPSLESFHMTSCYSLSRLSHIRGKLPLLKRALVTLDGVHAEHISAVTGLLSCISHVEELSLHVKENVVEIVKYPEPILLQAGKYMPNFPNLKHLDVGLFLHERNLEAIVMIFNNCPVLESLKLIHKIPEFTLVRVSGRKKNRARGRKKKDRRSRLPHNANGNCFYAYFRNLHLEENRKEFSKLLRKKCSYKRRAQN
ncbi:F-box/FBD/LRR protein [Rhynchospora pubera]|uniref:F-box/FBD/LRR protein n=1 Tax=Rhynchospora pubera TaxID=906938 RepID=A0AAV8DS79_9POAL|nr:F-box/FBD/LRR protein [Rhynchospora pubera]